MSVRDEIRPQLALPRHEATLSPGSLAWVLALPCAAVTVAIVLLLGPPLSHVLYPHPLPFTFLPNVIRHPEPVEGTRYLLSLIAPVLLAAALALAGRRPWPVSRAATSAVAVAQALGAALVVACIVKQREAGWQLSFFAWWQLLAGTLIAAVLVAAARRGGLRARAPEPRAPEPRAVRLAVPLLLALVTGAWFLSFVNTDRSIWWAGDPYNSGFMFDESFAVLHGFTPLADFTPAYGAVWPYLITLWMELLGRTLLAFTFAMWTLSIAAVLAIYGALRRVTRRALAALSLTLPIMAFAFFAAVRDVHHPAAIFQEMPLRNVAPFIVAWLLARHLDLGGRRTSWPLFVVAGLGLLNNVEFGLAALGGIIAALVWTAEPLTGSRVLRILAHTAAGLLAAYGLLAVVTLVRAGALPDPGRALAFARIYGMGGFGLARMPHLLGLPLVVYLTYAAALAVATVRAMTRAPNRVLTGMLAWSAIYGFGSGAYYMGASVPRGVPTTFPPWSFALALLAVVALGQVTAQPRRLPSVPVLAVLFGFGAVAAFVLDPPASVLPWRQVATIEHQPSAPWIEQVRAVGTPLAPVPDPALREFIGGTPEAGGASVTRNGTAIALLWSTGHAIADGYWFKDVVPFTGESMLTVEQLDETLRRLRAAGGSIVLVPDLIVRRLVQPLDERGFRVLTRSGYRPPIRVFATEPEQIVDVHGLTKWIDGRALPPGA